MPPPEASNPSVSEEIGQESGGHTYEAESNAQVPRFVGAFIQCLRVSKKMARGTWVAPSVLRWGFMI